MILSKTICNAAQFGASRRNLVQSYQEDQPYARAALFLSRLVITLLALPAWTVPVQAGVLSLPNASFESPVVPPVPPYAMPYVDAWQESPQPGWYEPTNNYNTPWEYLRGTFFNVPSPGYFIDNCDGNQAAFLFAYPEVAIFQDCSSRFNAGSAYSLAVGVIGGVDGSPPLYEGATVRLSLYYRDAASNMVTVAATTITNNTGLFPTNTHFVDFLVQVPGVLPTDPWANQTIGVQIASTVGTNLASGYWDLDNVRLTETVLPHLTNPQVATNQFNLTVRSEPGLQFEILAHTNLSSPLSNWASLGTVTNVSGTSHFSDPATNLSRRFYTMRQLP
jgi:hypothetical protein